MNMQNVTARGLIITAISMLITGTSIAASPAIAEDPEFRAAWAAYKAVTPEARAHQRHVSLFTISPVHAVSPDTRAEKSFAHHIAATHPQAICEAVRARVRYTPDEADHWQTGAETWNRKAGDCEDFAATVRELCLVRGFDAQMFIFQSKASNEAHAVVIGKWNGALWMSSNGDYRVVGCVAEVREIVNRESQWNDIQLVTYRVSGQSLSLVQPAARF